MITNSLRLAAATIFLATTALLHAAIAPAENLLPADTLAFFTVPDCAGFRTAAKTSPQMMFWNDPTMKAFHDKFMAKLTEKFLAPLEKDLGLKVANFLDLPQGQFTLAVTVNASWASVVLRTLAAKPMSTPVSTVLSSAASSVAATTSSVIQGSFGSRIRQLATRVTLRLYRLATRYTSCLTGHASASIKICGKRLPP